MNGDPRRKMTLSVGRTFNLGSFESARLDWGTEVDEGENFEEVSKELIERMKLFAKQEGWIR